MFVHPYYSSIQKRCFDFIVASVGLVAISPLILIISGVVFVTTGWPIIFTQKRTGQNGKSFTLYKFRTMQLGAHRQQRFLKNQNQAPEPMFKIFDDPRFVGVGKWLSRVGFDELPQLINVIKGEMSLVGPRPLPVAEDKKLSTRWSFRHQVKPGVFSEWTLSSDRHSSLTNWKKLDQKTLQQGGVLSDLLLISKTVWKVLFRCN